MGACTLSFLMLLNLPFPLISVLIFGLVGMAPAGILMALSAEAMRVESRSIGMGVFFMGQVLLQSTAPPVAGWLYDITNDVNLTILFAVALFLATGLLPSKLLLSVFKKSGQARNLDSNAINRKSNLSRFFKVTNLFKVSSVLFAFP